MLLLSCSFSRVLFDVDDFSAGGIESFIWCIFVFFFSPAAFRKNNLPFHSAGEWWGTAGSKRCGGGGRESFKKDDINSHPAEQIAQTKKKKRWKNDTLRLLHILLWKINFCKRFSPQTWVSRDRKNSYKMLSCHKYRIEHARKRTNPEHFHGSGLREQESY